MTISGLLGRLGLDRPDLRAWAMYDWAISGFQTIVMTAVFPIFFARVPAGLLSPPEATARYADLNTLYLAVVALLSPVLGAVADYLGIARRLLFWFMLLGVVSTAGFALIGPGDLQLASVLFVLAMIGATTSFVFYESLLPRLAAPAEVDRVSSAGYALGYIGGGILLAACLVAIQFPQAGRSRRGRARPRHAAHLRGDRGVVAGLLHPALPPRPRAAAPHREGRVAAREPGAGRLHPAGARPSARSASSARRSCCWPPS